MKYLKFFENNINEETKNKILILDISPSSIKDVLHVLQYVELYTSERLTVIIGDSSISAIYDITLPNLIDKIDKLKFNVGGGINVIQNGVDYIIKHKIDGRVLIITDGFDYVDIDKLDNEVSILSTESEVVPYGNKKCPVFYYNLSDPNIVYAPRYNTIEEYYFANKAQKFNL